jgi:hypothetical protein
MPTDKSYTASFRVGATPLTVEIVKGVDNKTLTQAIRYLDVVLPANALAKLTLNAQGIGSLVYDANEDGIFEGTVTPTASLSGASATDVTPPSVTITGAQENSEVRVTIASQDGESGVRSTFYSLDQVHYQPYVAPFLVDPSQTTSVYAFSEDNAANRSALEIFDLPPVLPRAMVWVGPSDTADIGTYFDLRAEVLKNGVVIGTGEVHGVGGGTGFGSARLAAIQLALSEPPQFDPQDTMSLRVSVRVAEFGNNSGTARLWYNQVSANSRFEIETFADPNGPIGPPHDIPSIFYFRGRWLLQGDATADGVKMLDVFVDRNANGNAYVPFGTWNFNF